APISLPRSALQSWVLLSSSMKRATAISLSFEGALQQRDGWNADDALRQIGDSIAEARASARPTTTKLAAKHVFAFARVFASPFQRGWPQGTPPMGLPKPSSDARDALLRLHLWWGPRSGGGGGEADAKSCVAARTGPNSELHGTATR